MTGTRRAILSNPASPFFGVASTAVMGVLPLIDATKLDPDQRRAVHLATALVTGTYSAVVIGGNSKARAPLRAAAGLAAGLLAWRFADANDAIDSRIEQKLRAAGARNPRRWMAFTAAALTFAGFLADRAAARKPRSSAEAFDGYDEYDETERIGQLDPAVRDLAEGILRAGNSAGATELLAQLDAAQEVSWGVEGYGPAVEFRVPDELPRAVPHEQVFPVRAEFAAPNGVHLQVVLHVYDGRLDQLTVEKAEEDDGDAAVELPDGWPDPSTVVYVMDGPDGRSAITAG